MDPDRAKRWFPLPPLVPGFSITLNKRGSGLLGGEGFHPEAGKGDGKAFVHAGGTVIEKQLNNEVLRSRYRMCCCFLNLRSDFDIEASGNVKTMVFGGRGDISGHYAWTGCGCRACQ